MPDAPTLAGHLEYLEAEFAAAVAAPLSSRRALLVVMLCDAYADRLFAADPDTDDILTFREALGASSPALATVLALAANRADGPRLVTEAVEIPLADYPALRTEDFMVSLYNGHTRQLLRVALPDGGRLEAHEVLAGAIAVLKRHRGG